MLSATEYALVSDIGRRLQAAGHGQRSQVLDQATRVLGCSAQTVYRKLAEAGFRNTERKRRSDAGESVLTPEQLRLVAGVLMASTNNKGQRMPVQDAIDILRAGGQLAVDVSESTVSRQLYQHRMHPEQLALPTPSQQLRSLHPNHVWQCDSTTGAYYYMPGGRLRWMPEDEFYKNKVQNIVKASNDLLTRYAVADHTSGAFKVRYYLGGETAANLLDMLTWAMWKQDGSPVHGVPFILMMDPGAANKSHIVRAFAKRLGIDLLHHAPGAARVTGLVEKTHDLVRMHYETRLRFEDPRQVTIDALNESIERWAAAYCATRVHGRHGRTRYGAWMSIQPEQLRVAASLQALRDAAAKEPEGRRVDNFKRITFGSPAIAYDLADVPGVVAGLRVMVVQNPFRAPAIDVQFICPDTGDETWHVVEPMKRDDWGYADGTPVIGQEMRTAAHSELDRTRNDLARQAYRTGDGLPTLEQAAKARKAHAQAYGGQVDGMADVKATNVPTFLPRRSTELELPTRQVEAVRLTVPEACKRLVRLMGPRYSPQVYAYVSERYPGGVPETELDAIAAAFDQPQQPAADQPATTGLRAVGGT